MIRMTRLKINKYRKVEAGCTLEFGSGHVFIIGPNGSGKSTLLRLIACLLTGDLDELCGQTSSPIDVEWTLEAVDPSGGAKGYRYEFRLTAEVRESEDAGLAREMVELPDWQLDCAFHRAGSGNSSAPAPVVLSIKNGRTVDLSAGEGNRDSLRIDSSRDLLRALKASASAGLLVKWDRELDGFLNPFDHFVMSDGLSKRHRFDEALQAYDAICGTNPEWSRASIVALGNGTPVLKGQFVPSSMLAVPPGVSLDRREIAGLLESLGSSFMAPAASLIGASAMLVGPRFSALKEGASITWRGFDLEVTWPGGVTHTHHDLSFGQKRLVAAIWYIGVFKNYPLLFDELANGMHARWVRELVEIIGDQQAFHALQNPLLLDWVGPSREDLPRQFVRCTVEVRDGQRVWTWRNPSDEEVDRLEKRWSSGFQNLSAILESEGWW